MIGKQPKLETLSDRALFRRYWLTPILFFAACVYISLVPFFMQISSSGSPAGLLVYFGAGLFLVFYLIVGFLTAMFPANLIFRIVVGSLLSIVPLCCLFVGALPVDNFEISSLRRDGHYANLLPIFVVGLTIPFLAGKHLLGWRLEFDWLPGQQSDSLRILGMLVGTGLVAFSFSLLIANNAEYKYLQLTIAMVGCGLGLLLGLPYCQLVFRSRHKKWFVFLLPCFVFLAVLGVVTGIRLVWPMVGIPSYWERIGLAAICASVFFFAGVAWLAVQQAGGRLSLAKERSVPMKHGGSSDLGGSMEAKHFSSERSSATDTGVERLV